MISIVSARIECWLNSYGLNPCPNEIKSISYCIATLTNPLPSKFKNSSQRTPSLYLFSSRHQHPCLHCNFPKSMQILQCLRPAGKGVFHSTSTQVFPSCPLTNLRTRGEFGRDCYSAVSGTTVLNKGFMSKSILQCHNTNI